MKPDMLRGRLVRLAAVDPQEAVTAIARWNCDTEYWRLMEAGPIRLASAKKIAEWVEKEQAQSVNPSFVFAIRSLEADRLIGLIELEGDMFPNGEAFVGIGIGERELWGRGFGSDAMHVAMRYAFQELNLRRVSLTTFEYNPRAIRSYEKVGFVHEGRLRQFLCRDGKRWDLIYLGISREEWIMKSLSLRGGSFDEAVSL